MKSCRGHWHERLHAAGVHFALSALIAALAAALVLGVWYPAPFRDISGGGKLFTLIVSVDVILGPLLTFTVFSKLKLRSELVRDLAVIAVLQIGALAYGLHTVWVARPTFVVFAVDRFQVFTALDFDANALAAAPPQFQRAPVWGPVWVAAEPFSDPVERSHALDMALSKGIDLGVQPPRWRSYETQTQAVLATAKPLSNWKAQHPEEVAEVGRKAGLAVEQLVCLPIVARQVGWLVVMNKANAQRVGYVPFGGF